MSSRGTTLTAGGRRHLLFLVALALGVVIRVVVQAAYVPALLFPDSMGYLARANPFQVHDTRPSGYSLFLDPFVHVSSSLMPVAVTQHVIGLGLAVLCYWFLIRRGLPPWGATVAVLPLLLDPLQLVLEHYVLSDVLFEALLMGACLLVLWKHKPPVSALVVAGVLVGWAGFTRGAGLFLVAVFVVALLCLRVGWVRLVAFTVAAIVPLGLYAAAMEARFGQFTISTAGPRFLYARLAPIVDCHDPQLVLPKYEKMLCPKKPIGQRPGPSWFMWGRQRGPAWNVVPPKGMSQVQVLKDFDKRVLRSQPVGYTKLVLADTALGFAPTRTQDAPGHPASYWLFQNHYWSVDTFIQRHMLQPSIRTRMHTGYRPNLANFMVGYRTWVFTPGPLMAGLALVAAAAMLGFGRSRRSGDRVAIGLLLVACFLPLLTASALSGFGWRYQLPSIAMLPVAGALGIAALVRGRRPDGPDPAPPLRALDRAATAATRLPLPSSLRAALGRAADRGWLQTVIGVLAGVLVALLGTAALVKSGWLSLSFASLIGLGTGLVVTVILLVARARAGSAPPADAAAAATDDRADDRQDKVPTGR